MERWSLGQIRVLAISRMTQLPELDLIAARRLYLQQQDTELAKMGLSLQSRERQILDVVARGGDLGIFDTSTLQQLRKDIAHYFESAYADKVVPVHRAITFARVFDDTFAIDLGHPWMETLEPLSAKTSRPPTHLRIRGLPDYLWTELRLREQNLIIKRVQECQVHFARLQSLNEKGTPFLALASADLRQSAYSACTGDYHAARWSALHAGEKILKAVIQAYGEKPRQTHVLGKLAKKVQDLSGLRITPSRLDGISRPAQLRYSRKSSYARAEKTFMQTLRVLSFVYPVLHEKYGVRADDWANLPPSKASAGLDRLVLLSGYPGFLNFAYWQKPLTGLYGRPITLEYPPISKLDAMPSPSDGGADTGSGSDIR